MALHSQPDPASLVATPGLVTNRVAPGPAAIGVAHPAINGNGQQATKQTTVAVIIVAYNSGTYLDRCLESLAQTESPGIGLTVTVVDNNSIDGTPERLTGFEGLRLQLLRNDRNVGFAAAANRGIRATESEYVLLLNPDTVVGPRVIRRMVEFLGDHPDAGIVSPKLVMEDGRIDPACHRGFPTPWASVSYFTGLERLFPRVRLFNGYHRWDLPLEEPHEVDAISGAFFFARRAVLEAIGGFDEAFFMYGEDIDACLRAREQGFRVYYDPRETVLHVKGTSTGIQAHSLVASQANRAARVRTLDAFYDSMLVFYDKHYARRYPRLVGALMRTGIAVRRRQARRSLKRALRSVGPK